MIDELPHLKLNLILIPVAVKFDIPIDCSITRAPKVIDLLILL